LWNRAVRANLAAGRPSKWRRAALLGARASGNSPTVRLGGVEASASQLLKRISTLAMLDYSPVASGRFQVAITVRIVATTTSSPIALRCVFGLSIFFSWSWAATR